MGKLDEIREKLAKHNEDKQNQKKFMSDPKNRSKAVSKQIEKFLGNGGEIHKVEFDIPDDLSFNPKNINTYMHRDELKKRGFRWNAETRLWYAPDESTWIKAYATFSEVHPHSDRVGWTGTTTAEKRTRRSGSAKHQKKPGYGSDPLDILMLEEDQEDDY